MNRLHRRGPTANLLLVCALLGLMGCGPGSKSHSIVKGKVTINGQALNAGTVTFTTQDNRQGSATISADGTYTMGDAPQGDVTITVAVPQSSEREKMMGMGKDDEKKVLTSPVGGNSKMPLPTMPGRAVPIPEKYSKIETSGLNYKVGKGEQTKNIELTQ